MKKNEIHIKNMVCPRCVHSVENILEIMEIPFEKVNLGQVALQKELSHTEEENLQRELKKVGFELITGKHQRISNQVKSLLIKKIAQDQGNNPQKLSVWLSGQLNRDYSQLSNIFSKTEGKSISDFYDDVKIMRIKELLEYDELNISEIADQVGYGDAAYLSTRFKKATGLTPSQYKKLATGTRAPLDKL